MTIPISKFIFKFFGVTLLQILLLNNLTLNQYIIPQLYIILLLDLPINISKYLLLFIGLGLGLVLDVFSGTMGIHSTACLILCFARPSIIASITPKEAYNSLTSLQEDRNNLFDWYLKYCLLLIPIFHIALYFFEAYTLQFFFSTLFRALICSIVTMVFIFIYKILFLKRTKA